MLELARINNDTAFIFASSYVYGQPQYLPIDEQHPINPMTPYNKSKALGEELCRSYHEDYGLKCVVLRAFNIYGIGQKDSFLIPGILKQIGSKEILLDDPEPRRDFLYVEDAVEAYIKAADYSGSEFDVFNIGSGKSYRVDEIVKKIIAATGSKSGVKYRQQRRENEIMNTIADISKAKAKLGWEPKNTIDEGLSKMIANVRNTLGAERQLT
jgi:UDP-glucose 4-epimerase